MRSGKPASSQTWVRQKEGKDVKKLINFSHLLFSLFLPSPYQEGRRKICENAARVCPPTWITMSDLSCGGYSNLEFHRGKNKQESCWYYYICVVEFGILMINLQRCMSFSPQEIFLSLIIPSEWGVCIWRFSCQKNWADSMRAMGLTRSVWRVGGCGWTCHPWCLLSPQEP